MTMHSEGITDADLDRFEKVAEPIYRSTKTAGEASRFQVSDLGMWVVRLVDEVRRGRAQRAGAPTDDEVNAVAVAYWGPSEIYDRERLRAALAGFRHYEVPEPSTVQEKDGHEPRWLAKRDRLVCELCGYGATTQTQVDAHTPEPQGEPSDAEVDAAARALNPEAWRAYDTPFVENPALLVAHSRAQARAALRAAGGVR